MWKLMAWLGFCLGLPPASYFLPGQTSLLLQEAFLVPLRMPKESVLITGVISIYFQFFLSFHHPQSKELGPKSCINHFCHLCPSSSQSLMFWK